MVLFQSKEEGIIIPIIKEEDFEDEANKKKANFFQNTSRNISNSKSAAVTDVLKSAAVTDVLKSAAKEVVNKITASGNNLKYYNNKQTPLKPNENKPLIIKANNYEVS